MSKILSKTYYMKNLFVLLVSFIWTSLLYGQAQNFTDLHPDSVMRQDPRSSQMMFEPGEIIVRFQDELIVNLVKSNGKTMTGISAIDELFNEWGITDVEPLIKGAEVLKTKQVMTTFSGKEFERPSLHNIFKLKTSVEPHLLFEAINALNESKHILYAEPNFIVSIVEAEPVSPPLNEQELLNWFNEHDKGELHTKSTSAVVPNDPLYSQQWGISATQIDQVWETTTGTPDQIIAILDTGVDWNHPDLTENIWNNSDESVSGTDSDGNGFVDDVRGWDFVNNDNNPADDNSHGTHVAGIAAAKGNNGIGIAGSNWGAKIMSVKVFQSSGRGNMATVVQGINYAAQNGATVINMSFGTYARSFALEDALANAYATAVLVAAAGNDNFDMDQCIPGIPMYPASISYVLGIMDNNAWFSNSDCNGPIFSNYPDLFNYELSAPATSIVSTIPNGGYRVYNGTSMASPLVAGAVAFYRSLKPNESQEIMWVNLINTVDSYLKIKDALEVVPEPMLWIVSNTIVDTLFGDGDGRPDAGETIELYITIRNTGAQVNDVKVGIELGEFEDPTVVQMITDEVNVGSISAYASRTNLIPLKFIIDEDVVDGRDIVFNLKGWYGNDQGIINQPFVINVENGIELTGIINEDLTLYPNKHYIVTENLVVAQGVTLTIKPGTKLKLAANKSLVVAGTLHAIGKPDSLIWITKRDNSTNWAQLSVSYNAVINLDYSIIEYGGIGVPYQVLRTGSNGYILNCIIQNNYGTIEIGDLQFDFNKIHNNHLVNQWRTVVDNMGKGLLYYATNFSNTNIINNKDISGYNSQSAYAIRGENILTNNSTDNCIFNNGNFGDRNIYSGHAGGNFHIISLSPNYLGSSNEEKIKRGILDFDDDGSYNYIDISNKLQQPSADNHGIVWKVLVNGADAQDEYVEPVGVGLQRFDVYFNRAMDIAFTPIVTFGVRAPYTQQSVNENGSWSADSTIYTAYKTMQLFTGDGINRVRVAGARDTDGFEIPIEDMRFEFLINAAGSASTEFMATPGMGKVELEWSYPEAVEDLLGYNLYRFQHVTDTTFTTPLLLNPTLVLDTLYTDFEVLPDTKYYYYYKILRTNLAETDSSRIVNSIPLTAAIGDANGDLAVNILDITHIVAFILNGTPQPFIFDAADVNADGQINLLDVIGVVNIIMNDKKSTVLSKPATVYLNTEQAEIKSDGTMAGLQFQLIGKNIEQLELKNLPQGFEFIRMINGDTLTGILFNMQNNTLPEGRISLFDIALHPGTLEWGEVFGGNYLGKYIPVFTSEDALPVDHRYSFNVYPNPINEHFVTDIQLPTKSEFQLTLIDIYGRSISLIDKAIIDSGRHQLCFDKQQFMASKGLYILQVKIKPLDKNELPYRKEVKLMVM
ncbi:MAG: peptidase S8/S53 subtilisin kexin sedolisin [Bacteroidetes bacterium]|nr:MAG: peptidase S8/S53 subtilisin kexin sedolisin [Bacteroidota bacterium]